jgi:glycosyltransferase involved in cell wall biosynthesis
MGIPTYNRAIKTLPATLQSALAQTYSNTELIVSDNCSTSIGLIRTGVRINQAHGKPIFERRPARFARATARGLYPGCTPIRIRPLPVFAADQQ